MFLNNYRPFYTLSVAILAAGNRLFSSSEMKVCCLSLNISANAS